MLSQEELDKLLEEGGEGTDTGGGGTDENKPETSAASSSDQPISQDELDEILGESDGSKTSTATASETGDDGSTDDDVDWADAFQEAAEGGDAAAAKAIHQGTTGDKPAEEKDHAEAKAPDFAEFSKATPTSPDETGIKPNLDFILELPLEVSVELGRSSMQIKDLLKLGQGAVVELNKMAGEPAEIYVNQKLMAKGEVVVVNEKFGVKLTEIISPADRVRSLG